MCSAQRIEHLPGRLLGLCFGAQETCMKNRVQIGTCSGPAEAAFVRSVFNAHELPVIINGEMHASAMGGLAGFVPLNILVDEDDAEEAIALLRDIREGAHALSEGDEAPGEHAAGEGDAAP